MSAGIWQDIEIPDVTFNMKTGEFKHEEVFTTTPWEEDE